MIPLVFAPHSKAGDLRTIPLLQVSELIVGAMLGPERSRSFTTDDPEQFLRFDAAATEAHEIVRDHLMSGALQCLVEPIGEAVLYSVPREYWQPKDLAFLEGDLAERLFMWAGSNVPHKFDNGAFVVDLAAAEALAAKYRPSDEEAGHALSIRKKPLPDSDLENEVAALTAELGRAPYLRELEQRLAERFRSHHVVRRRMQKFTQKGRNGRPKT